jgi:isoquinoline 1-oxidoreductase beta subunit
MHMIRRLGIETELPASTLPAPSNLSRRSFIQGVGGLALGVYFAPAHAAAPEDVAIPGHAGGAAPESVLFEPNAFIRIDADDKVTVIAKHLEMGQGTFTGLATLAADELDADWSQVRVEAAPADVKRYANTLMGIQGTGGSTAMANAHKQMRLAGAAARAMLVSAAAKQWKVPASEIEVESGVVMHKPSKRTARFGELAQAAATQPVPEEPKLKTPEQFTLIGKRQLRRKDSPDKTDGSAMFTQDIKLPDMLVAVVAHPPRFGASVKHVDDSKARAIPGVVDVIRFDGDAHRMGGVAVLSKNTWVAKQGRDALVIEWDETAAERADSAERIKAYRALAKTPGTVARKDGDADKALSAAAKVVEAEYAFPYLAHAAMEPLNCVVRLSDQGCEIWNGEQLHTGDQMSVAALLGIKPEQVVITQLYAGGSFGRRANPHADYVLEAVKIAKAAQTKGHGPIKLVWTREEDTRGGYYRPMFVHRVRAGLDADGKLVAWHHRMVGQSIMQGTPFEQYAVKDGIDSSSVEGASEPYEVPNKTLELHSPASKVPVLWWRSVGHTHTAFATETMIDGLAAAAGKDPVAFRLPMLEQHPRHRGVLETVAREAGWSKPLKPTADASRRGRGIAVVESFNSFVAQVVEVTVAQDGALKVDRVVCAVDCGLAINPDVIRAQMEGGIGFALTAALHSEITLKDGVVQQSNFHNYPMLHIDEMPEIEVHIVASAENPSGVGEPGVPPLAPALANAIFAATGKRITTLPIAKQLQA